MLDKKEGNKTNTNTNNSNNSNNKFNSNKGKKVMVVSAILTLFISVLKFIIGYISGSMALIADGLHSFTDVIGPIVVYFTLDLCNRKPNKNFPYGYSRIETIASLFVGIIIALTGFEILLQSIEKLYNPTPISNYGAVLFAIFLSIGITFYLYKYKTKVGREIGSDAIVSEGAHSLVDVYTTVALLFAVAGSYFGYYIVEPIISIIISIIVLFIGLKMVKNDFYHIIDYSDGEINDKIKEIALSINGVVGIHDIKTRKSGPYYYGELHVEINEEISFKEAHNISENVRKKILSKLNNVLDIIIHIDPVNK